MTLKLSRLSLVREKAEKHIDEYYASLINEIIGPLGPLHLMKRQGFLIDDDAEAVASRVAEQDSKLLALDKERRNLKDQVRQAFTSYEIKETLANTPIHLIE